jgi:flagellar motor switch protein FliN/FliY
MTDEQKISGVDAVSSDVSDQTAGNKSADSTAVSAPTGASPATSEGAAVPANLALLLDAELEATIRFGDREMPLKEIFGLMPGDVVELDQMVDEPAQFIVAGRTIAKGEVVVVGGNFGLRITEVASASQRAEVIRA